MFSRTLLGNARTRPACHKTCRGCKTSERMPGHLGGTTLSNRRRQHGPPEVAPQLPALRLPRTTDRLLEMSSARYLQLWHLGRQLANVERATPHALRHGAASMDALYGVSDSCLLERGPWSTLPSVQLYRKPARYIRKLALLSAKQVQQSQGAPQRIV